jgi:acyl carrier protein
MRTNVAIAVVVLLTSGAGCRRKAGQAAQAPAALAEMKAAKQPVPKLLRAAVGRSLEVNVHQLDPDVSIATLKPDLDDLDVVELVLSLEEMFEVSLEDEALAKVMGGADGAIDSKKLTLRNLWQLIETARGSVANIKVQGGKASQTPAVQMMMKYQLVLQWPGSTLADYDAMVAIEDLLIGRLAGDSQVDGHDVGSGETNIFIGTNDPRATFEKIRVALSSHQGHWKDLRAAYRDIDGTSYTVLRPKGLKTFTVK